MTFKQKSILPGFNLALGFTLFYLCLIVLLPLSAAFLKTTTLTWGQFWMKISEPRALASYRLTFSASLLAAGINLIFGFLVAWVLVRYRFPGKRLIDSLVDLPFALPTAVAGISLTAIYSKNGWLGGPLESLGIRVAYTPLGIIVALTFIGLPFVVRNPAGLEDLELEAEEPASLGAGRWQTFTRVVFPAVPPGGPIRFCHGIRSGGR